MTQNKDWEEVDHQDNTFSYLMILSNACSYHSLFLSNNKQAFLLCRPQFSINKKDGLYVFLSSPLTLYPIKPLFPMLIESVAWWHESFTGCPLCCLKMDSISIIDLLIVLLRTKLNWGCDKKKYEKGSGWPSQCN